MSHYPLSLINLIKNLARLPGIGEKTAERLAMHILHSTGKDAQQLAQSIMDIKEKTRLCSVCSALCDDDVCSICSNPARNSSLLCVVEQQADMVAIEKSGSFKGIYHILQGILSPMNGVGPEEIRIKELISRVAKGGIQEVVLATGMDVEGESTSVYISERLEQFDVKVTRIASGVPMGSDLKYVDQVTLKKAMETRHVF